MSNTESVRNNSANTSNPPIHSASLSKLRQISGSAGGASLGLAENDSAALLDAFSEIFARMAASDAAPAVTDVTIDAGASTDDSANRTTAEDSSEQNDHAAQDTDTDDRGKSENNAVDSLVVATDVIETKPLETAVDVKQVVDHTAEDSVDLESLVNVIETESDVVNVADVKPDVVVDETVSIKPAIVVEDSGRHHGHGKQNQESTVLVEVETVDAEVAASTKQGTPSQELGPEVSTESVVAAGIKTDESTEDTGRRSRRGRRDRHHVGSNEPLAQSAQTPTQQQRSGGIPIPSDFSSSIESAPLSTAKNNAPSAESSPKIAAAANAAVQAATKVAAASATAGRAGSVTAQTGLTSNVQSVSKSTSPIADVTKKPQIATKNADTSEAVNRAKLIQRVSKAFQHLGPDGGHVRLRLAPAELGTVRLEMRMNDRRINARVVAESDAAGSALREHLPELRQRLESQGIQIERFEIVVDASGSDSRSALGHGQSQSHQEHGRNDQAGWRPERRDVSHVVSRDDAETTDQAGPLVTVPIGGGIDVRL